MPAASNTENVLIAFVRELRSAGCDDFVTVSPETRHDLVARSLVLRRVEHAAPANRGLDVVLDGEHGLGHHVHGRRPDGVGRNGVGRDKRRRCERKRR